MYALVVLASLASTLLFLLALREDRPVYWGGYVAATTIALYLHVTAALVLAAHLTYFALARRGDSRPRRRGWLAFAALTLPYLPLAAWEVRFVLGASTTWHQPIAPLDFLRVSFTKFAANRADPASEARARWLYLALALLGALPIAWRHAPWPRPALSPRRRATLLALLLALPLALFYAVTLIRPLFSDRYLIVATPALYLLVAGGVLVVERFARALAPLALVALLATAWVPLRDVNLAAQPEKEDWRGAYAVVAEHLHPRDLVLVHPGYLVSTLDYYRLQQPDGGPRSLRDVPALTIPAEDTAGADERQRALLDLYLQEHTAGFERVWLVLSTDPSRLGAADPQDQVRDWYRYNGRLIYERQFNGVWLGLYAYSGPFRTAYYPPVPVRLDVAFGGRLTLVGYGYDYSPGESGVRAGDHVPLVLRWIFPSPDAGLYAIRWHLLDAGGHEAASGVEPLLGHFPLRPWERPSDVWDYHDLALPATLEPGSYRLAIECIPADGPADPLPATRAGEPLPGGAVPLGWIEVRR